MAKSKEKNTQSPIRDISVPLKELLVCRQAYETLRSMKIKGGKGARRIGKLLALLQIEFSEYDKAAKGLIEEHGEEKPGGVGHWINNESRDQIEAFTEAHDDMIEDMVDLRIRPISIEDFGDAEVPLSVMSDMQMFFDFGDDEIEQKSKGEDTEASEESESQDDDDE